MPKTLAPLQTWTDGQGAKIRGTYVKWAQGEKTRLKDVIEKKKGEVKAKEEEVEQAKDECCMLSVSWISNAPRTARTVQFVWEV